MPIGLALKQSGGDPAASAAVEARLRWHLERSYFAQAQRLAEALLDCHPDATPILNNLSLIASLRGCNQVALTLTERVLMQDPDNLHAHANAIVALVLSGRVAFASARVERLMALPNTLPDAYVKKAEALSYLGEDEQVLALLAEANAKGWSDGYLYHLAACAALGRGQNAEAARLWQKALQLRPDLESAAENFADLEQPPGQRQGPWPFPIGQWVPEALVQELAAAVHTPAGKPIAQGRLPQVLRDFLSRHPEVPPLVPALLARGDPRARQFALHLCHLAGTQELRESLKAFALGQRGSDEQRFNAAVQLVDAGVLPAGPLKMWVVGAEQELLPIRYEIYTEPISDLLTNKLAVHREKDLPHIEILKRFLAEEVVHAFEEESAPRQRIGPAQRLLDALGSGSATNESSFQAASFSSTQK